MFKLRIVRSSFIPSKDFCILRELLRYKYKLTCMKSSEKNRFTNALTVGNCKLDMVFSDIFGKSSKSIIDIILNNDSFSDEDIINCVSKKCKSSSEDILSSITGIDRNSAIPILSEISTDMSQFKFDNLTKIN